MSPLGPGSRLLPLLPPSTLQPTDLPLPRGLSLASPSPGDSLSERRETPETLPPALLAPSLALEEHLDPLTQNLARMALLPGLVAQQALESPEDEAAARVSIYLQNLSLRPGQSFLVLKPSY